jgi:hypothetical protein
MNKPFSDSGTTHPMSAERVNFKNGMIVTADDLTTAMGYPIALMQAVNRAVFGCGVVCGFKLGPDPELCGKKVHCDPCDDSSPMIYPNSVVEVGRGTALDCYGLPIELCKPVRVELSPETCGCDGKDGTVCIFIRRVGASEAPRGDCCAPAGGTTECSRQRDHVLIRAFAPGEEPEHACMQPAKDAGREGCGSKSGNSKEAAAAAQGGALQHPEGKEEVAVVGRRPDEETVRQTVCKCLLECDACECCGDGWVLLGCVELCNGGIIVTSLEGDKPYRRRKWIKTIECLCREEEAEPAPKADYYGKASAEEIARDDRQLQLMRVRDPGIEKKIERIVASQGHRKFFKAQDIRNMDHFIYVLEERKDDLKDLVQFARAPEKLDEYLTAARSWKEPAGKGEG